MRFSAVLSSLYIFVSAMTESNILIIVHTINAIAIYIQTVQLKCRAIPQNTYARIYEPVTSFILVLFILANHLYSHKNHTP